MPLDSERERATGTGDMLASRLFRLRRRRRLQIARSGARPAVARHRNRLRRKQPIPCDVHQLGATSLSYGGVWSRQ